MNVCIEGCVNCEVCTAGNDIGRSIQPDVSACCDECTKSLKAWLAANPGAVPLLNDNATNACVAWTFPVNKICYLKNSAALFHLASSW